ncbi:hypothetical protein CCY99_02550 [Helicobacter sp. 16-1353]|uniref:hypothetical protein n=1 Tax=Helicobacter sp. 16-1353 TaxID=2004996 RepID=UPI000DCCB957|nr:hypothetical protein [Helicobacter sp. 16-1353]RAX54663.1 hypothetical protein CCY99_02550 [Helicobacter sp. 16-1353]
MISKILNISKISQNLSQTKHYNTTLPILLQVMEKTRMGYLLKLGNNIIEAKSMNNLQIGSKYWAIVKDSSVNEILISNLIKQPKIFDNAKKSSLKFDINEFESLLKDSRFIEKFSDNLIEKSIASSTKDDFLFLTNSLIALNKKILNIVINDNKKDILLQIKKPKDGKIEFSAIFNNLGLINGVIYNNQSLIIKTQYKNVRNILENNIKNLEGFDEFDEIRIIFDENINIFFNLYNDGILDLEV